jgi:hypothetical protein
MDNGMHNKTDKDKIYHSLTFFVQCLPFFGQLIPFYGLCLVGQGPGQWQEGQEGKEHGHGQGQE